MKKSKILSIIFIIVSIALIVGGILLLVKGTKVGHVDFDFDDMDEMFENQMASTGYYAGGGVMLFLGIACLISSTVIALAKPVSGKVGSSPIASILSTAKGQKQERYCAYCGSLIEEGQGKCPSCGAAVKKDS